MALSDHKICNPIHDRPPFNSPHFSSFLLDPIILPGAIRAGSHILAWVEGSSCWPKSVWLVRIVGYVDLFFARYIYIEYACIYLSRHYRLRRAC